MAICKNCGEEFETEEGEEWKKLCLQCWKEENL
jgi:formylmethanofuran dehydrogenase subunit E